MEIFTSELIRYKFLLKKFYNFSNRQNRSSQNVFYLLFAVFFAISLFNLQIILRHHVSNECRSLFKANYDCVLGNRPGV